MVTCLKIANSLDPGAIKPGSESSDPRIPITFALEFYDGNKGLSGIFRFTSLEYLLYFVFFT
jgi:hypothetical protein